MRLYTVITSHLLICLIALLTSNQAKAEDLTIILPSTHVESAETTHTLMNKAWSSLEPGTSLTVLNGRTGDTIVSMQLSNGGRHKIARFVDKDFADEREIIGKFVAAMEGPKDGLYAPPLAIPALVKSVAKTNEQSSRDQHVLMLGNPLFSHPRDPGVSMVSEDGIPQIPSDRFLIMGKELSPYGQGADDPDLEGIVFHICADLPDLLLEAEKRDLARFWSHYLALRGGVLATFTSDIQGCLASYKARTTSPLVFTALDEDADLEMKRLTMKTAPSIAEIDPRDGAYRQAERQQEQERLECAHAKEVEAQVLGLEENGVTSFSRFTSVDHPTLKSVSVSTGVSYRSEEFPDWDYAHCYFYARNSKGSKVSIDLGGKNPGDEISWKTIPKSVLKDVGLTTRNIKDAHTACRFPNDPS